MRGVASVLLTCLKLFALVELYGWRMRMEEGIEGLMDGGKGRTMNSWMYISEA